MAFGTKICTTVGNKTATEKQPARAYHFSPHQGYGVVDTVGDHERELHGTKTNRFVEIHNEKTIAHKVSPILSHATSRRIRSAYVCAFISYCVRVHWDSDSTFLTAVLLKDERTNPS
eukprot:scaffold2575_cov101-Cylindrotheca_fusiformis.AAC.2